MLWSDNTIKKSKTTEEKKNLRKTKNRINWNFSSDKRDLDFDCGLPMKTNFVTSFCVCASSSAIGYAQIAFVYALVLLHLSHILIESSLIYIHINILFFFFILMIFVLRKVLLWNFWLCSSIRDFCFKFENRSLSPGLFVDIFVVCARRVKA